MLQRSSLGWIVGLLAVSGASGQEKNPVVVIDTSMGYIKVELFKDKAPLTVNNFLKYVDDGHYDRTIFHRVIKNFVIQGGGLTADMKEKRTRAPIKNEAANGLSNKRGTIAMARKQDPDSADAQFYINVKDNAALDRNPGAGVEGYAVFGQVVEGMDVMDKICEIMTDKQDVPTKAVIIKRIRLLKNKQ
jgi:cyclophilin family peptidyl-prolyl cis-trans isomerase